MSSEILIFASFGNRKNNALKLWTLIFSSSSFIIWTVGLYPGLFRSFNSCCVNFNSIFRILSFFSFSCLFNSATLITIYKLSFTQEQFPLMVYICCNRFSLKGIREKREKWVISMVRNGDRYRVIFIKAQYISILSLTINLCCDASPTALSCASSSSVLR